MYQLAMVSLTASFHEYDQSRGVQKVTECYLTREICSEKEMIMFHELLDGEEVGFVGTQRSFIVE